MLYVGTFLCATISGLGTTQLYNTAAPNSAMVKRSVHLITAISPRVILVRNGSERMAVAQSRLELEPVSLSVSPRHFLVIGRSEESDGISLALGL